MLFVCFNDTATTEIDTYLHTLSLHDALPISWRRCSAGNSPQCAIEDLLSARGPRLAQLDWHFGEQVLNCTLRRRSEEHTSELQSLMRISSAVFCLKKKRSNNMYITYVTITSTAPVTNHIHTSPHMFNF